MNWRHALALCLTAVLLSSAVSVAALEFTDARAESVAQRNDSVSGADAPGEAFSIAIGAQGVKVTEMVGNRSLNAKLTNATTDESLASIVASEARTISGRLDTLSTRYRMLTERNASGDEARVAVLRAEGRVLDRRVERLSRTAATLPADVRDAHGITERELSVLSARANALEVGMHGTASNSGDKPNVTVPQSRSEATTEEPTATPDPTTTATPTSATTDSTAADESAADQPAGSTESGEEDRSNTDNGTDDGDDSGGSDDSDDTDDDADDDDDETGDDGDDGDDGDG